jgi:hypothetical protein
MKISLTVKIDFNTKGKTFEERRDLKQLAEHFDINEGFLSKSDCPVVTLLPRGTYLTDKSHLDMKHVSISEEFRRFIWPQLKIKITFVNVSPYPLSVWW